MALGVFYLHAARQVGLELCRGRLPRALPLLRIETEEGPLALDPFSEGRVVRCRPRLSRMSLRTGLMPDVASRLELLMAPISDRAVLIRLQNNIFARAQRAKDWPRAERSALRRALLSPADHRPWLVLAAHRRPRGPRRPGWRPAGPVPRPDPRRRRRPSRPRAARGAHAVRSGNLAFRPKRLN
ncbi:transglutaminase family protein [Caulobacter segnis]